MSIAISDQRLQPTMTAPTEIIKALERNIASEVAMGLGQASRLTAEKLPMLLTRIRQCPVDMDEVTTCNEYLLATTGPFSLEQKREIATVVKSMTSGERQKTINSCRNQKNLYLQKYMPARLWSCVCGTETLLNKFKVMAAFMCQNLGLRNADEQTKKLATVICLEASSIDCDPNVAYDHVREFSNILDQQRTSINTPQTMLVFPESPQDFMRVYTTAYGVDDPPVECRIDEPKLKERLRGDITPSRNTSSRVYTKTSPAAVAHRSQAHAQQQQQQTEAPNMLLMQMLQQFMFGQGARPPMGCNINYLQPGQQSASSGASAGNIAIQGDPPAPKLSADGTLAIEDAPDPATQPASIISGGIAPACLQPPPIENRAGQPSALDKLKALSDSIGQSSQAAKATAAKRKIDNDEADGDEEEDADDNAAGPSAKGLQRKPAGASASSKAKSPAAKAKAAKSPAAKAKAPNSKAQIAEQRDKRYAELLKRPAASTRPRFALKPTQHHGGKIYWQGARNAFRVYKRKSDTAEEQVRVDPDVKDDAKKKFQVACAIIEADTRPI
jgi:hypothetical protein